MTELSHVVDGEAYKVSVGCPSYLASGGAAGATLSPEGAAYIGRLISLRDVGKQAAARRLAGHL